MSTCREMSFIQQTTTTIVAGMECEGDGKGEEGPKIKKSESVKDEMGKRMNVGLGTALACKTDRPMLLYLLIRCRRSKVALLQIPQWIAHPGSTLPLSINRVRKIRDGSNTRPVPSNAGPGKGEHSEHTRMEALPCLQKWWAVFFAPGDENCRGICGKKSGSWTSNGEDPEKHNPRRVYKTSAAPTHFRIPGTCLTPSVAAV